MEYVTVEFNLADFAGMFVSSIHKSSFVEGIISKLLNNKNLVPESKKRVIKIHEHKNKQLTFFSKVQVVCQKHETRSIIAFSWS